MCRGGKDTADPRRCPCNSPSRRRAYQNARYAIKSGRKRHPVIAPVAEPKAAPAAAEADLKTLLESVKIVAGSVFRTDHKDESPEENIAFQQRRHEANRDLKKKYGSLDLATVAAGGLVAARAEELSGTSADRVKGQYDDRLAKAEAAYKAVEHSSDEEAEPAMVHLAQVKRGTDPDTLREMRELADSYQAALAEIRPMGGTLNLHEQSQSNAAAKIQEVAELYPTEWLETSNRHSMLVATLTADRAHYADRRDIKETEQRRRVVQLCITPDRMDEVNAIGPKGPMRDTGRTTHASYRDPETKQYVSGQFPVYEQEQWKVIRPGEKFRAKKDGSPWGGDGWEKWDHPENGGTYWRCPDTYDHLVNTEKGSEILTGGRTISYIAGRDPNFAISAHEFGHRTEYAIDGVTSIEHSFLARRTSSVPAKDWPGTMEWDPLVPLSPGSKEMVRPDHFTNTYMGKDYGQEATEVMSMGMEGLFAGSFGGFIGIGGEKPDIEVRDLVLGVLASVSGSRSR